MMNNVTKSSWLQAIGEQPHSDVQLVKTKWMIHVSKQKNDVKRKLIWYEEM